MNEEEIKKYLKDNLRVYADIEETHYKLEGMNRLVIQLWLERDLISETKIWV